MIGMLLETPTTPSHYCQATFGTQLGTMGSSSDSGTASEKMGRRSGLWDARTFSGRPIFAFCGMQGVLYNSPCWKGGCFTLRNRARVWACLRAAFLELVFQSKPKGKTARPFESSMSSKTNPAEDLRTPLPPSCRLPTEPRPRPSRLDGTPWGSPAGSAASRGRPLFRGPSASIRPPAGR